MAKKQTNFDDFFEDDEEGECPPMHHTFALPAHGRSSIILCGAIIKALMAAACEAAAERTSPPAFLSCYCDVAARRLTHRGTTIVQSDGYPIKLRFEWGVRSEANFVWMQPQMAATAAAR